MSTITGFCMFFLSFCPLWISVLFIDIKSICEGNPNVWTEIISVSLVLIVSIIALVVLMCDLNPQNTNNQQEYRIVSAKEEKTITAEYLLSYILPLFAFDFTVWNEVVLFLVFFLHKSARVCHLHGLFPPFRRRFSATLSGLLATQTIFLNNERGTSKNAVTTFKEVHRNDGLQENSYASKYGVQPTRNGTQ